MKTVGKALVGMGAFFVTMMVASSAFAQEAGIAYAERDKWIAASLALGVAIAAFGGALGQGRAAAAALDGIARNPGAAGQIRGPMILGLALIESLVIYALIISLLLVLKVG